MPVEIADWNDLDNVRNDLSGDYVLVNDLDENTDGYAGIGDDWEGDTFRDFTGTFNGDGFEIRDLDITVIGSGFDGEGLFGNINDADSVIENLHVDGVIEGPDRIGLLCGRINNGTIKNCSGSGQVINTGGENSHGFIGRSDDIVENCVSHVDVISDGDLVGGLVGLNIGTVEDSYATGSVEGDEAVGGLVGRNIETAEDSYATGSVVGEYEVGGLAGRNEGTVTDSYATGSVEGGDFRVGGFVGYNNDDDTVTDSYATGSVEGGDRVGGFAGQNNGELTESYATGSVEGDSELGGLVGRNFDTVTDSYWDTESSGQSTSEGGTGLTTSEMQGSEAETNMDGFDFADVWDSVLESDADSSADGYPILLALDREDQLDAQTFFVFDLSVETKPATDISEFSATLNGELVDLDEEGDDADVFFEFGENVADSQTPIQTLTGPATFDGLVDELESNTTFEFRAVAEAQHDDETVTDEGDILTFDTEIVTLDGTISLDGVGVENADVVAHNLTKETFGGQTNTDVDGNYTIDLPSAARSDTVAVAVDFDDGTERYGRLVTTVLE